MIKKKNKKQRKVFMRIAVTNMGSSKFVHSKFSSKN